MAEESLLLPSNAAPEVPAPAVGMDQVQPMLTNMLQSLQSGQGEQALQRLAERLQATVQHFRLRALT